MADGDRGAFWSPAAARARRRDRARCSRRRPRCDLHLSLGAGGGRARSLSELTAAHPDATFAAHRARSRRQGAPSNALCADDREARPYSGFVHNAGQSYDTLAVMMDQDKAEAAMQVNFWSFTRLAKAVVRPMMRAKDGRVVVIGSVAAQRGNPGNAAYAASKARAARLHAHARGRDREPRHHGQLRRAGLHRHRDDGEVRQVPRRDGEARSRPGASPSRRRSPASSRSCSRPPAAYITGAVPAG